MNFIPYKCPSHTWLFNQTQLIAFLCLSLPWTRVFLYAALSAFTFWAFAVWTFEKQLQKNTLLSDFWFAQNFYLLGLIIPLWGSPIEMAVLYKFIENGRG